MPSYSAIITSAEVTEFETSHFIFTEMSLNKENKAGKSLRIRGPRWLDVSKTFFCFRYGPRGGTRGLLISTPASRSSGLGTLAYNFA